MQLTELAGGSSNPPGQQDAPQSPSITPSQTLRPTDTADTQITIDTATPTLTQTAVVQPPTITPTSTMENRAMPGRLIYRDDFSDSTSGWDIGDTDIFSLNYWDDHYLVNVKDTYSLIWSLSEYNISDGGVQTTAKINQDQLQASYGVVFRVQDWENFYYFDIASNGTYNIGRCLNGVYKILKKGTNNSAIRSTGYNDIYVIFLQNELIFYMNSDLIATVFDNSLSEGYVGVWASTGLFGGFEVWFDQFEIAQ